MLGSCFADVNSRIHESKEPALKIVAVDAIPVAAQGPEPYLGPVPKPLETTGGYFRRPPWRSLYARDYESLLVRLECDGGEIGWGEALAPVAPEVPAAVVERILAPLLLGRDPRPVACLRVELGELMRERGHLGGHQADAIAACEIALWDLKGRVLGESVAGLLGGPCRTRVPAYVSGLSGTSDEERAAHARDWADRGFRSVKLHLGHGVETDLGTFDAAARAVPELRVAVDAHWAYEPSAALRLGRALQERGAWFLEAPLAPEDVDGHRELAAALDLPVAVGEALRNRHEFRPWLERRSLDICQPDVGRTGVGELVAVAAYAEAYHIRMALHHSTGLGVALAAGVQVAAALSNADCLELQPRTIAVANRILKEPVVYERGAFELPPGPGLGVEVDPAAVERMRKPS